MKMNKMGIICVIVFLILLLICSVVTIYNNIPNGGVKFITFNSIDDMHLLDAYIVADKIAEDNNLKNISPIQSYDNIIEYNGSEFTVHAYVFLTHDDAVTYFKDAANMSKVEKVSKGIASAGLGKADYATIDNTRVIIITGKNLSVIQELVDYMLTEYPQSFRPIKSGTVSNP